MTLSDYRRAVDQGQSVAYFSQVVSASEYYPPVSGHGPVFGMILTEGNYSSGNYRFGFQGQEMDYEIKGTGNSVNFKYRMHDPRIGRFFAVDPLAFKYPHNSPYAFSENRIIDGVELEGLEVVQIHFLNVRGGAIITGSASGGLFFDIEGVGFFTTTSIGGGLVLGASGGASFSFWPGAQRMEELEGKGFSIGGSYTTGGGGEFTLDFVYENGDVSQGGFTWGISYLGLIGIWYERTNTKMHGTKLTWKEIGSYLYDAMPTVFQGLISREEMASVYLSRTKKCQ